MTDEEKPPADSVFGPVLYSYTRKQAIEDGVLIDVSKVYPAYSIPRGSKLASKRKGFAADATDFFISSSSCSWERTAVKAKRFTSSNPEGLRSTVNEPGSRARGCQ